jgi:hypothetical protein
LSELTPAPKPKRPKHSDKPVFRVLHGHCAADYNAVVLFISLLGPDDVAVLKQLAPKLVDVPTLVVVSYPEPAQEAARTSNIVTTYESVFRVLKHYESALGADLQILVGHNSASSVTVPISIFADKRLAAPDYTSHATREPERMRAPLAIERFYHGHPGPKLAIVLRQPYELYLCDETMLGDTTAAILGASEWKANIYFPDRVPLLSKFSKALLFEVDRAPESAGAAYAPFYESTPFDADIDKMAFDWMLRQMEQLVTTVRAPRCRIALWHTSCSLSLSLAS